MSQHQGFTREFLLEKVVPREDNIVSQDPTIIHIQKEEICVVIWLIVGVAHNPTFGQDLDLRPHPIAAVTKDTMMVGQIVETDIWTEG